MDPTANLAEQRTLAAKILRDADDPNPFKVSSDDAVRLAELVQSLDEWLSRGAFLPDPWRV